MKENYTYRILSLFLAFLVLTSSVSFAIDIHYCGDQIRSISIFGKAESCSMKEQKIDTSSEHKCCEKKNEQRSHCKMEGKKKGCCHNEQIVFEQDNDLKLSDAASGHFENINPILVYTLVSQYLISVDSKPTFYSYYDPPLLAQNLLVQQQVFRI